jgi:hypothetical protein
MPAKWPGTDLVDLPLASESDGGQGDLAAVRAGPGPTRCELAAHRDASGLLLPASPAIRPRPGP